MNCEQCGEELVGKRADARFCNDTCKKRWVRAQKPPGKRGRPRKRPENELAAEVVSKVKAPKPVMEVRVPAADVLSRIRPLPSSAPAIPRGVPIVAPSKKKAQPKGDQS